MRRLRIVEFVARSVAIGATSWVISTYGVAAGAASAIVSLAAYVAGLIGARTP